MKTHEHNTANSVTERINQNNIINDGSTEEQNNIINDGSTEEQSSKYNTDHDRQCRIEQS